MMEGLTDSVQTGFSAGGVWFDAGSFQHLQKLQQVSAGLLSAFSRSEGTEV